MGPFIGNDERDLWGLVNNTSFYFKLTNEPNQKTRILHFTKMERFTSDKHASYWAHSSYKENFCE